MIKTHLPQSIILYIRALLCTPWRFNVVFLAKVVCASHDTLTRSLHRSYSWKKALCAISTKRQLHRGYLVIDETEVDKSYAKTTRGLSWLFSHKQKKHIYGYQIILICWTNGHVTIPLAWKIYDKSQRKTKTDLALELMQYCLFVLGIRPRAFLFDAFYASEQILKYLVQHNQSFFTQAPKSRLFNKIPLKNHEKGRPYWTKTGYIKGNIHVQVVKNRRKYFVTNHIGIPRQKQLDTYRMRWSIEQVFRFVKDQLGLEKCQSTSKQMQHNHFGACFTAYALLQDIAVKKRMTVYRLKEQATLNPIFARRLFLSIQLEDA